MARLRSALLGGAAGAVALTAVHQTARLLTRNAPRMDVLGMRTIRRAYEETGATPPEGEALYYATMAGDLLANTAYYALAGLADEGREWAVGSGLGAAAGVGGVVLPPRLGLGSAPSARTKATAAMTVAWYTLGGLVAAGVMRALRAPR